MSSHHPQNPSLHQIFSAAQHLIQTNPGKDFTMDQLASQCGISRATLYRHVGSRAALLQRMAANNLITSADIETPGIRERILQATRKALGQSGSTNFTIDQVALEAGVGVATVYRHFGNKENLLQTIARQIHPRQAAFDLLQTTSGDLHHDLRAFVQSALQFMCEIRDIASLYISGDSKMQELFTTLRGDQNRTIHNLTKYLQSQMDTDKITRQDPFNLATALVGMIIGFSFLRATYTDQELDPDLAAETIVETFLHGISTKDTP
jgi:AcrR family transcriptional regulator